MSQVAMRGEWADEKRSLGGGDMRGERARAGK